MVKPMTVYIAGPISGLSYDEVVQRYKCQVHDFESMGYSVLFPLLGKGYLRNETTFKATGYKTPVSTNRAIVSRDHWMVKQSDILFADFTQGHDRVSIGTISEIAWGFELGKHIVIVLPDDNIHHHAFVTDQANIVFKTTDHAMDYFMDFMNGLSHL